MPSLNHKPDNLLAAYRVAVADAAAATTRLAAAARALNDVELRRVPQFAVEEIYAAMGEAPTRINRAGPFVAYAAATPNGPVIQLRRTSADRRVCNHYKL